ncbi:hypothetical protein HK096_003805, partial [Nowakowskiella sp. JEL0078]
FFENKKFEIVEPNCEQPTHRPLTTWGAEEDQLILHFVTEFQGNWSAVASAMQSLPVTFRSRRSEWDCYWRYKHITLPENDSVNSNEVNELQKSKSLSAKTDIKKRKEKHQTIFSLISKCAADREEAKRLERQKKNESGSQDSHKQIQASIDQKAMTPMELSALKEKRDKDARQMHDQHRQNNYLRGIHHTPLNRPPMGMPGPQNHHNGVFGIGGQHPLQLPFSHFRPPNSAPGMFPPSARPGQPPTSNAAGLLGTSNQQLGPGLSGLRPGQPVTPFPMVRPTSSIPNTAATQSTLPQTGLNSLPGQNQFNEQMRMLMRSGYMPRNGGGLPFGAPPSGIPQIHNPTGLPVIPGQIPPALAAAYRQAALASGKQQNTPGIPTAQNLTGNAAQDAAKMQILRQQQMLMFNAMGFGPGPNLQPPTTQPDGTNTGEK